MPVGKVKEAKLDLGKSSPILMAQNTRSESKGSSPVPKGVSGIKDSMSSYGNNISYNIAQLYGSVEQTNSDTLKIRLRQLQNNSNLLLETEKKISKVLKDLESTKKAQPLLDSAKKILEAISASASAVIGFELISAEAPIIGSVFIISAALSGIKLSGFLKEYKGSVEKLSLASNITAMAYANSNTIVKSGPQIISSALLLLNGVVNAGKSFNSREQNQYKAQYLGLEEVQQKIDFTLKNFLKEIELSFEKDEQILRSVKQQILANTNLD